MLQREITESRDSIRKKTMDLILVHYQDL